MVPTVYSLEEAEKFFLQNSSGECYVHDDKTGRRKLISSFPDAQAFYKPSATEAVQEKTGLKIDPFHSEYRQLTEEELAAMASIKNAATELWALIDIATPNADKRMLSLAKTNLEQSIMWAVKAITA